MRKSSLDTLDEDVGDAPLFVAVEARADGAPRNGLLADKSCHVPECGVVASHATGTEKCKMRQLAPVQSKPARTGALTVPAQIGVPTTTMS
ncbi:hypothetical protein [Caballeronia grimmiae]|uniref:hypothetical protein n=1 Tax=Caballeronia grimmiae TaxID=1071679 RepID=UPI0038BAE431